jgi:hypothetical protein
VARSTDEKVRLFRVEDADLRRTIHRRVLPTRLGITGGKLRSGATERRLPAEISVLRFGPGKSSAEEVPRRCFLGLS